MAYSNVEESSRKKLLNAHAHTSNHIFSHINSMSLNCAVQLGIPDVINKHDKPITLSELVEALLINKAKSDGLRRLMRILVHSKFFDKVKVAGDGEEEEAYSLTPSSRLLLRDEPLSLVPLALAILDPDMMDPWYHFSDWFRDESPSPFATKHKMQFWEFHGANTRLNSLFAAAMAGDADFSTAILTNECRHVFEGLETMVDVGGGTGATAKAISDAFPGLKCTVLDLPHVVPLQGCDDLEFVSGDMFDFVPRADAAFLKWILHDWNDEECVKILEKCKEAIAPNKGGKLIIVEMVLDESNKQDDETTETQLFVDLQMMMLVTGKERSEKEWAKLFFSAGFNNYHIYPILGLRSVIEVFP